MGSVFSVMGTSTLINDVLGLIFSQLVECGTSLLVYWSSFYLLLLFKDGKKIKFLVVRSILEMKPVL